ncbi:hypothetical protein EDC96DRAFT_573099 [Choanephora cucurbitarum]|nr:hypothetical protein EDC96DRAFT_573099 [Choanephora cucurbitarum]
MAFAFTSLRHEIGNNNLGDMPFQIHGQMYPMQSPFFYLKKDNYTRYAQLYILCPQLAASLGASNNNDLDREVTSNLSSQTEASRSNDVRTENDSHVKMLITEEGFLIYLTDAYEMLTKVYGPESSESSEDDGNSSDESSICFNLEFFIVMYYIVWQIKVVIYISNFFTVIIFTIIKMSSNLNRANLRNLSLNHFDLNCKYQNKNSSKRDAHQLFLDFLNTFEKEELEEWEVEKDFPSLRSAEVMHSITKFGVRREKKMTKKKKKMSKKRRTSGESSTLSACLKSVSSAATESTPDNEAGKWMLNDYNVSSRFDELREAAITNESAKKLSCLDKL